MVDSSVRRKLLTMFDSLKRVVLDARNSTNKEDDIWTDIATLFNDNNWKPKSTVFTDLHPDSMFTVVIDLSLPSDFAPWTPDTVMKALKELWSNFKKAVMRWRSSGNGKENQRKDGAVQINLNGTVYLRDPTPADDDIAIVVHHVDDDRWDFCQQNLSVAYLWGLVEMVGLTDFCVQNIGKLGLENGNVPSARDGTTAARKGRKELLVDAVNELPRTVRGLFQQANMFEEKLSDRKLLIDHRSQLRLAKTKKREW
jgi:hypothetical protein